MKNQIKLLKEQNLEKLIEMKKILVQYLRLLSNNLIELLQTEIINADKQLTFYTKELQSLKYKVDNEQNMEKMIQLETVLREKEQNKTEIIQQTRQLKYETMLFEKQLNCMEMEDFDSSKTVHILTKEVAHLKNKLRDCEARQQQGQLNYNKIETYYLQLKKISEKQGIELNLENMNDYGKQKTISCSNQKKKGLRVRELIQQDQDMEEDEFDDQIQITEAKIVQLRTKLKQYKQFIKTNEIKHKNLINTIQNEQVNLEFQMRQTQAQIKEKEKEILISQQRSNELKKVTKYQQLVPLEHIFLRSKTCQEVSFKISLIIQKDSQKFVLASCLKSRHRHSKRIADGGIFSNLMIPFDDADVLGNSLSHQIASITVYHNGESLILGIKATYRQKNQEEVVIIEGGTNIDYNLLQTCQQKTLKLGENEWIKSISGYATDCIDFLSIETNLNEVLSIGIKNLKEKPLEFNIAVGIAEIPITLFGGLDYKTTENEKQLALAFIGLELINPYLPQRTLNNQDKSVMINQINKGLLSDQKDKKLNMKQFLRRKSPKLFGKSNNLSMLKKSNSKVTIGQKENIKKVDELKEKTEEQESKAQIFLS